MYRHILSRHDAVTTEDPCGSIDIIREHVLIKPVETPAKALEKELETYQAKLQELKQHEGKFVLVHGPEIVDFFSSYDDAIKDGYRRFGVDTPFLVKQVQAMERVQFISRIATGSAALR